MGLFSTKQKEKKSEGKRPPNERGKLTSSTLCELWIADDGRINYKLVRANPKDASKSFTTFRPEDTGELIEAAGIMCGLFAESPNLSSDAKAELKELGNRVEKLVADAKRGFREEAAENGETERSVLLAA